MGCHAEVLLASIVRVRAVLKQVVVALTDCHAMELVPYLAPMSADQSAFSSQA